MKYCTKCGKELRDEAVICPGCGCAVGEPANKKTEVKANIGLCILSALIPFLGLILFFLMRKESPKAANVYGPISLGAIGVWLIILTFSQAMSYDSAQAMMSFL